MCYVYVSMVGTLGVSHVSARGVCWRLLRFIALLCCYSSTVPEFWLRKIPDGHGSEDGRDGNITDLATFGVA